MAWEHAWHRFLDVTYAKTPVAAVNSTATNGAIQPELFTSIHGDLCRFQHNISSLAALKISQDGFKDKWRAAGPAAREKHYFEAVKRALAESEMEIQRRCVGTRQLSSCPVA
jgi:hypothetical protein